MQALCFLAGANSIFAGEKLLTTPNPDAASDRALMTGSASGPAAAAGHGGVAGPPCPSLRRPRSRPDQRACSAEATPSVDRPCARHGRDRSRWQPRASTSAATTTSASPRTRAVRAFIEEARREVRRRPRRLAPGHRPPGGPRRRSRRRWPHFTGRERALLFSHRLHGQPGRHRRLAGPTATSSSGTSSTTRP